MVSPNLHGIEKQRDKSTTQYQEIANSGIEIDDDSEEQIEGSAVEELVDEYKLRIAKKDPDGNQIKAEKINYKDQKEAHIKFLRCEN